MSNPAIVSAFRVAAVAWLLTVYVKVDFYLTILADARLFPIEEHPLFPAFFASSLVVTVAYWSPLVVAPLLASTKRWALLVVSSVFLVAAFMLGWSLDTHNDATWITAFWSACWLLWLAVQSQRRDDGVYWEAIVLAQGVVALCFLGGFVGKLTAGYESGDVLRHIYLERKSNWPWPWLRTALDHGQQVIVMRAFSGVTIVMEGALVLLPVLPTRFGCRMAIAAMLGIVLISHVTLISVMSCLIGLLIAALLLLRRRAPKDPTSAAYSPLPEKP